MSTAELLTQVRALGVSVCVSGNNIALKPISAVPDSLLTALKAAKPELLALLRMSESAAEVPPSRVRPSSWPDPHDTPRRHDHCSCCGGSLWWTERDGQCFGWRCDTCHPSDHLSHDGVRQVQT